MAVGDGANDLAMLSKRGLSAWHCTPNPTCRKLTHPHQPCRSDGAVVFAGVPERTVSHSKSLHLSCHCKSRSLGKSVSGINGRMVMAKKAKKKGLQKKPPRSAMKVPKRAAPKKAAPKKIAAKKNAKARQKIAIVKVPGRHPQDPDGRGAHPQGLVTTSWPTCPSRCRRRCIPAPCSPSARMIWPRSSPWL